MLLQCSTSCDAHLFYGCSHEAKSSLKKGKKESHDRMAEDGSTKVKKSAQINYDHYNTQWKNSRNKIHHANESKNNFYFYDYTTCNIRLVITCVLRSQNWSVKFVTRLVATRRFKVLTIFHTQTADPGMGDKFYP